jgi:hypothetical protein
MSYSNYHPNVSLSQFQGLFDAALNEYSRKTGKYITMHPLTVRLQNCDSSDSVLGILQEQAQGVKQYREGGWGVRLMRRLKPIVDILVGLSASGVLEGIGLVKLIKIDIESFAEAYYPPCRVFHQRKRYLPVLVSCSQYVLFLCLLSRVYNLDVQIERPPKELPPVMRHLLSFLNVLNITLVVSRFSPLCPPHWAKYWSK